MAAIDDQLTATRYQYCVDSLRSFVQGLGKTDVVLGLSGGIDSTVVACMCADALGVDYVHGVMLPGPFSSKHSVTDAQELADNLGIQSMIIPITDAYTAFAQTFAASGTALTGLASENTQARCRMVVLMALTNAHDWLLINTDNKTEAMMGYSTLYGDTAGAFAPMGGLYKVDVYRIARWINASAEARGLTPPIPYNVFIKPPSAELAPDQRDEDTLGSYDELDRILIAHVEHGLTPEALIAAGENPQRVTHILATTRATQFKRNLLPPFPPIAYDV